MKSMLCLLYRCSDNAKGRLLVGSRQIVTTNRQQLIVFGGQGQEWNITSGLPRSIGAISQRYFSSVNDTTTTSISESSNDDGNDSTNPSSFQKQPFVQTMIRPGEWDLAKTNPLYRPKYRSNAAIISAEDFANQPTVSISGGEYENFFEGMVTLGWLDQADNERIYQLYCDLLVSAASKHNNRTSHEYVMRVIAQKYNITAERVAAIVQLQHNQEQIIASGGKIFQECADYMDQAIKNEIEEAYREQGPKPNDPFIEDPVGVIGLKERKEWQTIDDVFDVDDILADTIVREEDKARMIIDTHVYMEDVDDSSIPIPMDNDCSKLLQQKVKLTSELDKDIRQMYERKAANIIPSELPKSRTGVDRPRWKFVAQTINVRKLKKKHAKNRSYTNNSVYNTLVEQNGQLRQGTMDDIQAVSWKPIRNVQEHTYKLAKKGWLDRTIRGKTSAWGKAPVKREVINATTEEEKSDSSVLFETAKLKNTMDDNDEEIDTDDEEEIELVEEDEDPLGIKKKYNDDDDDEDNEEKNRKPKK